MRLEVSQWSVFRVKMRADIVHCTTTYRCNLCRFIALTPNKRQSFRTLAVALKSNVEFNSKQTRLNRGKILPRVISDAFE